MKVSGTIILDEKKTTSFLVMKEKPITFPSIEELDESKTALGVILNYYLDVIGINPDLLRLEELSMVHKGDMKQNLFVFSINSKVTDVKAACAATKLLEFTDVKQLQGLFNTVEIDMAPFFS
ncbi:Uncharacterized protein LACOL_1210 [Paucilactobacillus oligofermentans DSM 15707 = LMG 22743]|nr:hypothetical protein [Paucilactobacillus oligofermentans]CUS26518.1 Uncharacterized protein LACOL_1210 [Paucilactobacillus oligofermentans DSM 15707 = LMG 22743]